MPSWHLVMLVVNYYKLKVYYTYSAANPRLFGKYFGLYYILFRGRARTCCHDVTINSHVNALPHSKEQQELELECAETTIIIAYEVWVDSEVIGRGTRNLLLSVDTSIISVL